jgi:hypothetical protein
MKTDKRTIGEVVDMLKEERDELRLKIHLGTMEARDEWSQLEKKWQLFTSRLTTDGLDEDLSSIADELEEAYHRIRSSLPAG